MGRGGGGGRGVGGGKGSGGSAYKFYRKFFGLGPPRLDHFTNDALRRVAIARGLRDSNELLVQLGKYHTGISKAEAFDLLNDELGLEALIDAYRRDLYSGGMRYEPCKDLLKNYKKAMQNSADEIDASIACRRLEELKKYCGYIPGEKL